MWRSIDILTDSDLEQVFKYQKVSKIIHVMGMDLMGFAQLMNSYFNFEKDYNWVAKSPSLKMEALGG